MTLAAIYVMLLQVFGSTTFIVHEVQELHAIVEIPKMGYFKVSDHTIDPIIFVQPECLALEKTT